MTSDSPSDAPWVALFDLDGTLTWSDTLVQFLSGYLMRHPWRMLRLWRVPLAVLSYAAGGHDRGLLKSRVISSILGGARRADIDAFAAAFAAACEPRGRFRPAALKQLEAHRSAGDHLVLLSASPDLYVPFIGRVLRVERTLCTEVAWNGDRLVGTLTTENRRGPEKTRCLEWLRTQYPGLRVVAYGNSDSDLDHMRHADRALLVNGNRAARVAAMSAGIPTADWT